MECEICGRSVDSAVKVRIEGAVMQVCESCARYGERVETRAKRTLRAPLRRYEYGGGPLPGENLELVDGYPDIIRSAREKRGLKQDELGKLINERASVIARIEGGKMEPNMELAKKLERTLDVKILSAAKEEGKAPTGKGKVELTLGDVVRLKKK